MQKMVKQNNATYHKTDHLRMRECMSTKNIKKSKEIKIELAFKEKRTDG